MPVMNMLPGGSTLQIPLDAPTSFSATAGNAQVELTWTDPLDKYATPEGEVSETGDQLVSEWDHTVLVRKTGSQPAGPNDGTVVVSSSVRNQYQSTAYVDSGLTNDTTYYYGVFAYNKDGVASSGAFVNATPKAGTPIGELAEGTLITIKENGAPVEFYVAKQNYEPDLNRNGRSLVLRKDCIGQSVWGIAGSPAAYALYEDSVVSSYLNSTYKSVFSSAVQSLIGNTTFYVLSKTLQTYAVEKSIFTVSTTEIGAPQAPGGAPAQALGSRFSVADSMRIANTSYWSRSFRMTSRELEPFNITTDGTYYPANVTLSLNMRPCFTLPSTAFVDADLTLIES